MDPRVERSRATAIAAARHVMEVDGLDAITPSRLAQHSGLSRRTIYRLWPNRSELLHDVLVTSSAADYPVTGELSVDVRTHLVALAGALTPGPLARILGALAERAPVDPELAQLRQRLAEGGREPLLELLRSAVESGVLPDATDIDLLASQLEGPVIYEVCVRGRTVDRPFIDAHVDELLSQRSAGRRVEN